MGVKDKDKSLLEIAVELLSTKHKPQPIMQIAKDANCLFLLFFICRKTAGKSSPMQGLISKHTEPNRANSPPASLEYFKNLLKFEQ